MSASTNANAAVDDLRNGAENAAKHADRALDDLARRAERIVHDSVETLRDRSKDYVDSFRERSRDYADTAGQQLETAQKYVVERVHERPLTAALTALGVGVLVGLLMSGRNR